jgi:hypothetical protein
VAREPLFFLPVVSVLLATHIALYTTAILDAYLSGARARRRSTPASIDFRLAATTGALISESVSSVCLFVAPPPRGTETYPIYNGPFAFGAAPGLIIFR